MPRLPPATYHYSEQTKLNAIGLIVGSRDTRDHELIERGIRKLGRMDLHSALHALGNVDLAPDTFVYQAITQHLLAPLPEYRIYCGWLVRNRYGSRAAACLVQLLSDPSTRVHRYAFRLFETREIEAELLEHVVKDVAEPGSLPSWLLTYRVKLLGMRERFRGPITAELFGPSIVSGLYVTCRHQLPGVRLASYRSLSRFPEWVSPETLGRIIVNDAEPRLRALAAQTTRLREPN